MTNPFSNLPRSPIWRRFAALCYDMLLLIAISLAYFGLANLFATEVLHRESTQYEMLFYGWEKHLLTLGWAIVITLFYTGFWCKNGQTLGMQAWQIRTQNEDGTLISRWQSALRMLPPFICIAVFLVGASYESKFLTLLGFFSLCANHFSVWFCQKRSISDITSKTVTVVVPKDQHSLGKSGGIF